MITRNIYLEKIRPYIDQPLIKVLVGIRRAGKSTLLEQVRDILLAQGVAPEKIIHINFEDLNYINIQTMEAFTKLVQGILQGGGRHYLLFDEIQNIDGWDRVVNGLLAGGQADIYITGSNSKLLSSELSTHLTGRYINIPVYPLNFAEYLDFRRVNFVSSSVTSAHGSTLGPANPNSNTSTHGSAIFASGLTIPTSQTISRPTLADLDTEFQRYLEKGGFPVLHLTDYTLKQGDEIISDIYSAIIFRDLIERKGIRKTELLSRVVKYVFDNIGNIFSAKSVSDYLKSEHRTLSTEIIYNYLELLEEVFVIERVPRFDIRGKTRLKTQEKFFLGDIGLLYAVNGRQSSYISGILENVVYHELKTYGYTVYIGKNQAKEIDFVAERDGERMYLQVATHLTDPSTIEREFGAFTGISDNHPKIVLSLDKTWGENRAGVTQRYLPEFLLEELYKTH